MAGFYVFFIEWENKMVAAKILTDLMGIMLSNSFYGKYKTSLITKFTSFQLNFQHLTF